MRSTAETTETFRFRFLPKTKGHNKRILQLERHYGSGTEHDNDGPIDTKKRHKADILLAKEARGVGAAPVDGAIIVAPDINPLQR